MTFADLFSGIGGFRLALESLGLTCVLSCENDRYAKETYDHNFTRTPEYIHVDDIKELAVQSDLPSVDIVTAGFPCQSFSSGGLRKGMLDERGMLFWDMVKVIKAMRPKAFILENVPALRYLSGGTMYQSMMGALTKDNAYCVHTEIVNSYPLVPQRRPRLFFVGFKDFTLFNYPIYEPITKPPVIGDIIEPHPDRKLMLTSRQGEAIKANNARRMERDKHARSAFYTRIYKPEDCATNTIVRNSRNSRKVLYAEPGWERPRFFSVREIARLMGFPDSFEFPVSDTQAYKQLGNAVVPAVIELLAKQVVKHL